MRKNCLSIPGLSSEKPLAEVISDKRKPTLFVLATIRETTAEIIFSSIPHFLVNTIIDMILLNLSKSTFFVFITSYGKREVDTPNSSFISFNNFFESSFRHF